MPAAYIRDGFLSSAECRAIQDAMDRGAGEDAEVLGAAQPLTDAGRQARSIEVDAGLLAPIERQLDAESSAVAAHFRLALSGREGAGFIRYPSGGFYGPHVDWAESAAWPDADRREVAVVVFLNSSRRVDPAGNFEGGVLRLLAEPPLELHPRRGTLVAFPARLLHEVTPVWDGVRDVVVDWYYRPVS